ncbi:hypothetical protein PWG15_10155 [Ensifer adhaerens]|uniref:hypothetical protein n=1 Tax=Ensifer adhaerens TaxID=106592 RepID=UPI0023AA11AE|nr:hypothetical protein [Ensifer adhaerens]WDZ78819.1 hypothetical protein PWG15_10155 [Ensifer adhaerens]
MPAKIEIPKYAQLEHERRFLVDRCPDLSQRPYRMIEDLYVDGSRLRARAIAFSDARPPEFKFCKKYPSDRITSAPIVNMYLTAEEYELLSQLPGKAVRKRRYRLDFEGSLYCIDVFENALCGLIMSEVEASSSEALAALAPPPWGGLEVTEDPFFRGANLAAANAAELQAKISALRR